jgi:transcriptional regulator with XRE-family HTH domain
MSLADEIKHLREEKGYSQRKLSYLSGVSNTEISRIENGDRPKPSPDTLEKLSPHLGISYNELMEKAGYLAKEPMKQTLSDPHTIVAAHRTDDDYKKGLPPEAIEEIREHIEFIRYKYRKKQPDGNK